MKSREGPCTDVPAAGNRVREGAGEVLANTPIRNLTSRKYTLRPIKGFKHA